MYENKTPNFREFFVLSNNITVNENIINRYLKIDNLAISNNCKDLIGMYFYIVKVTEMRYCKSMKAIPMFLSYITTGFGEKPFRTLLLSSIIILAFAYGYMKSGLIITNINDINFGTYLHFSIVTFTTVGYRNIIPVGISIMLSSLEMILGVIMIALFIGMLLRKMIR